MSYTDADLVILIPMLGRPHHVAPLLATIREATPRASTLFLCSPHDWDVHDAVREAGCDPVMVPYYPIGDYARKINHGVRTTSHPLIFTGASDLKFHAGWFDAAIAPLATASIGLVGTNDLGNARVIAGEHSTHSLITRLYAKLGTIDEPGKVLHEGYHHEFVDDEMIETAKHRGAWGGVPPDAIVEHLHPAWGKAESDQLYADQHRRMAYGYRLYHHRRRMWHH